MARYTAVELENALQQLSSSIANCKKMQPKFAEGTSQHSLLKNRVKALVIAKLLLTQDCDSDSYTTEELTEALEPISSIQRKCEKGQVKFVPGTAHHTRFHNLIKAMQISTAFLMEEIEKRNAMSR